MNAARGLWKFASTAVLAVCFLAIPVFAEEGSAPNPADTTTGVVFRWINFVIVFGSLGYLVARHGGGFSRANAKAIAANIHEASAAKAAAHQELQVVEAKILRLDQEISEMRDAARRNWEAEAQRLHASGLAEIDKINQAARAELAASERAAHQQLREIAASLAVQRAAALVSSRMNPEVRARMFQSFLGGLNGSAN
jgi:F0F1-type ATP synthase membrane subunit b/b'